MTMAKRLWQLAIVALLLALASQYTIYRAQNPGAVGHASWVFQAKSFKDVINKATDVVEAQVVSVQSGPPLVTVAKGEPGGQDVIPTENITMVVTRAHKGGSKVGQTLTIFRTGGSTNIPAGPPQPAGATLDAHRGTVHQPPPASGKGDPNAPAPQELQGSPSADTPPSAAGTHVLMLTGDPPYVAGERYFLALEPRPNNTLGPVSPAGRYRIGALGTLQAVGDDPVSQGVNGKAVGAAEAVAQGQGDILPNNTVQVQEGGPPAAFRSTSLVLKPVAGSRVTGSAVVTYDIAKANTKVELIVIKLQPMSVHPARIQGGVCGSNGAILHSFPSIHASDHGVGSAITKFAGSLTGKKTHVNVYAGMGTAAQSKVVACVNLS
jgi:hypothetical protein